MTASKACSGRTLGCGSGSPRAAVNLVSPHHHVILSFPPAAGQLCWSVSLKAQETPISPCCRAFLHQRSQMKVGSLNIIRSRQYSPFCFNINGTEYSWLKVVITQENVQETINFLIFCNTFLYWILVLYQVSATCGSGFSDSSLDLPPGLFISS